MPQSKRGKSSPPEHNNARASRQPERSTAKATRRREIMAAVCFILALFSFIGYFNADGAFIGFFINLVKSLVGHGYFALPPALLLCSVILSFHRGRPVKFRVVCTLILPVVTGALVHLFACRLAYEISLQMLAELWKDGRELLAGGVVSGALTEVFTWLFGRIGTSVVFICAALFLLMAAFNKTIAGIVDSIKKSSQREYIPESAYEPMVTEAPRRTELKRARIPSKRRRDIDIPLDYDERPDTSGIFADTKKDPYFKKTPRVKTPDELINEFVPGEREHAAGDEEMVDVALDIPFMESKRGASSQEPLPGEDKTKPASGGPSDNKKAQEQRIEPLKTVSEAEYVFPPVDLLPVGAPKSRAGDDEVRVNSERLEAAFRSFGVNVNISNATRGPAVTRYEAELEAGVKLSKLTGLADDIALSLGTSGVRIAAMPNKISTVGIEVPNKKISVVYLRDIIESQAFSRAKSKLTFAIGMDISGEAIVGNISKLPHMLLAGTTGSGKSVCLNSIILSILFKATPDDVRFIMIDPKMVEFKVYNDIPHLLVPVVTDIKKAAGALQWAVFEMMKRYTLFAETTAREVEGYNQIARRSSDREPLPQIIIVIDELADLMMMAAKEVEESVCRVAQMGRAAGMHLIIATQSPRADVITGLMKANIPSRISFKVSSALESRIILDAGGNADKLVGNGDMLYAPIGTTKPMRVQGTWVSDRERENVVDYIKRRGESRYSEEVMGEIEKAAEDRTPGEKSKDEPEGDDHDELLPQAVDVILETG